MKDKLQQPFLIVFLLLFWKLAVAEKSAASASLPDGVAWTDVSGTLGFPLGGIGTGYSAFGEYGFVHVNFDDRARDGLRGLNTGEWEYTQASAELSAKRNLSNALKELNHAETSPTHPGIETMQRLRGAVENATRSIDKAASPAGFAPSTFGFVVREGRAARVLQTDPAPWLPEATAFQRAQTTVSLPRGRVIFSDTADALRVTVDAFTPLLPHDLRSSTTPVQVLDVTIENLGPHKRTLSLALQNSIPGENVSGNPGRIVFRSKTGELSFALQGGATETNGVGRSMVLAPGEKKSSRFFIAWFYPKVDKFQRYYTRQFKNSNEILDVALTQADSWSKAIDAWHDSIDVPPSLKRLWFGSLSAVETSTIMTADPFFLEVETPHNFYNTMDVFVYANWVYMINWPELERMDMDQYLATIPTEGPNSGLVLHSIWNDSADYVEEPTFLVRIRRDGLWYGDSEWTRKGFAKAVLAANHVYALDNRDGLIVSKQGNQSYDIWKMPGISSYVNSAWIYGLSSLVATSQSLHVAMPTVGGEPADQLLRTAQKGYDHDLWNNLHQDWNVFYRTPGANPGSIADSFFTDQLFGKWVTAIDFKSQGVLPQEKIHSALLALYRNNVVVDPSQHFRGWVDGMQAGHIPDMSGRHSRTFWIGPQINLASLLGMEGEEAASLDVMQSIEKSLGENVLAAGEWNKALNEKGAVELLPEEAAKDSPRFAPYPRYTSCWEYLIRLVGLQMDEHVLSLNPFHTVSFNLNHVEMAGMRLTVHVQNGWTYAKVDHRRVALPVTLDRSTNDHEVEFLK
jgi:uncharacterized protein (DUF608 family)